MSKPYLCPMCKGVRQVSTSNAEQGTSGALTWTLQCPACKGTGIVWEPEQPREVKP